MGAMDQMPVKVLAAILALVIMTGCSGGEKDDRVPVPEGFQEYRTGQYGFAHPSAWQRKQEKDDQGRPALTVLGPELPGGVRDGHVHVQRYESYPQDFDAALSQFRSLAMMNRYRVTVNKPMKVAGAVQAHRFEASYDLEGVPFTLVGLYALTEDDTLVEFMVRVPRQGRSAAQASAIFTTFRLRGH